MGWYLRVSLNPPLYTLFITIPWKSGSALNLHNSASGLGVLPYVPSFPPLPPSPLPQIPPHVIYPLWLIHFNWPAKLHTIVTPSPAFSYRLIYILRWRVSKKRIFQVSTPSVQRVLNLCLLQASWHHRVHYLLLPIKNLPKYLKRHPLVQGPQIPTELNSIQWKKRFSSLRIPRVPHTHPSKKLQNEKRILYSLIQISSRTPHVEWLNLHLPN